MKINRCPGEGGVFPVQSLMSSVQDGFAFVSSFAGDAQFALTICHREEPEKAQAPLTGLGMTRK